MTKIVTLPEANRDIVAIQRQSATVWGTDAARRYFGLIMGGYEQIRQNPTAILTRRTHGFPSNYRYLRLYLVPQPNPQLRVKHPRHIIYYRIISDDRIEILRVLHDKMNHKQALNTAIGQK
ncbi:MAG: type II toxin-antitoxin system RelE/ParE family toxin [Candidatus Symbiobacter sp.]|nr:type II toxin-antitoxin system RelE/ParE family toxin [Candidatus Symbiobacter sp.]